MRQSKRLRDTVLTLAAGGIVIVALSLVQAGGSVKLEQVLALFAIWSIATVSLNLINGSTGILSLGHHGFMLVGGYVTALLVLPKSTLDLLASSPRSDMTPFSLGLNLHNLFTTMGLDALAAPDMLWFRFVIALIIGGLVAAIFGLIVGLPSLRLRGDYLAVVTFAFGEAIRLLASTRPLNGFTNGALGFAGVPSEFGKSLWWTFGALAIAVFIFGRLKRSSFGRALHSIREDEIAARAMGVNTSRCKLFAFGLSAFFAGIAGGLYVSWVGTARLDLFQFILMFYLLVAISVGGTGSITGALLGTALVVVVRQYGDFIEEDYALSTWLAVACVIGLAALLGWVGYRAMARMRPRVPRRVYPLAVLAVGVLVLALIAPSYGWIEGSWQGFGMRSILLAVVLLVIMVFRPSGVLGHGEFSWGWLLRDHRNQPSDEERAQDAWLSNPELKRRLKGKDANKGDGKDD